MKLRIFPLSLLSGAAFSGAALAGGYEPVAVEPQPTTAPVVVAEDSNWTGFYVGGQVGQTELNLPFDDYDEALADFGLDIGDGDLDGVSLTADGRSYGLHAGYLRDFGQIVAGGELEYARTELENDSLDGADISTLRAKGRVGYDAGSFMPYLTAGASQVRIEEDDTETDVEDTLFAYGIGAEYQMASGLRIGVEYLRERTDDFDLGDDLGDDFPDVAVETDTLNLRVSYAF